MEGGWEINAWSSSLTELQFKIDCDLERKQEKTARSLLAGSMRTHASCLLIGG